MGRFEPILKYIPKKEAMHPMPHQPSPRFQKMQKYVDLYSDENIRHCKTINGSAVILTDCQIPFQDGEFMLKVLTLAKKWKIKQGISAGDFFNQDVFSVFIKNPEAPNWKQEADKAKRVANIMVDHIPEWLFLLGNHDVRMIRQLANQINHNDILRLSSMPTGCEADDFYYCIVMDKQGNQWRITHPKNLSTIPARVPQKLADKYAQNIVAGHGHLTGLVKSTSGMYTAIDSGVCCEPRLLEYASIRDSVRPCMNKGAVILKEDSKGIIRPWLLLPETDWEFLLGKSTLEAIENLTWYVEAES